MSDVDAVAAHSSDILVGMWHPAIRHGPASSRRPVDVIDATMGICASTRCCCATVGRFRPAIEPQATSVRDEGRRGSATQVPSAGQAGFTALSSGSNLIGRGQGVEMPSGPAPILAAPRQPGSESSGVRPLPQAAHWRGDGRAACTVWSRRLAGGGWRTAPLAQRGRFRTPPAHSDCWPKDWTAHGLRHGFVSLLPDEGVTLE
jgi:hypothetical protein